MYVDADTAYNKKGTLNIRVLGVAKMWFPPKLMLS